MPVDDEARLSLADTLEDMAPALAETASQHLLGEELLQMLALLTTRERMVITLRFGIGDGQSRTLLEVGKELGISRERVRQLEVVALKKLRSKLEARRLALRSGRLSEKLSTITQLLQDGICSPSVSNASKVS